MDNNQTFLNACRNGQKSIVQIFLKKGGIDINKRDQEGNTALYYACQKGYRDIVALLLDNDADASCINNLRGIHVDGVVDLIVLFLSHGNGYCVKRIVFPQGRRL